MKSYRVCYLIMGISICYHIMGISIPGPSVSNPGHEAWYEWLVLSSHIEGGKEEREGLHLNKWRETEMVLA